MATYTKETALYDTGAIAGDISDASETASNYLTDITGGGVYVHSADTSSDPTAATAKGVKITDQVDIIRGGASVASFGSTVTVGGQGGAQAIIDSGSFSIKKTSENFSISLIPTSGNDNGGGVIFGDIDGVADTFIVGTSSSTDGFMQLGSGTNTLSIASGSQSNTIQAKVNNSYISVQASGIVLVSNNGNGAVNISGECNIASGKKYKIGNVALSASDVGAVPTTRTVNGKALSANISLTYSDVGAAASSHTHSYLPLSGGTMTGTISAQTVRPKTASGYDLGSSDYPWDQLWMSGNIVRTTAPGAQSSTYTACWHKTENNNYTLVRPSSSRKYKKDIEDISDPYLDPHKLYDLRVVQFRYKEDDKDNPNNSKHNPTAIVAGFIAEEVAEIYPVGGIINENDEIDDWSPRTIIPPMLKLIQEQHQEIEKLKLEIKELKHTVTSISEKE